MHLTKNGIQQRTVLTDCRGEITGYTCGTAMQRTIYLKINCEMGIEQAYIFAQQIIEKCIYIEKSSKGCNRCEHSPGCPEKEEQEHG